MGALVIEDADDSGVLWKKSLIFNIFTFFAAATSLCVLPLTCFFKAYSHHFEHLYQSYTYSNAHYVVTKLSLTL